MVVKTGKKLLAGALRTAAAVTLGEGGQAVASELMPIQAENSIKNILLQKKSSYVLDIRTSIKIRRCTLACN